MKLSVLRVAAAAVLLMVFDRALPYDWPRCGNVDSFPGSSWHPAKATDHDWNADKLADAEAVFESLDSAAVMVIHRGHLIAAWGDTAEKFTAQSLRKSLLSSLVGIAVDNKTLALDATLADLNINDTNPHLTESERQATLRDLLLSRSGIYHSALYEDDGWQRRRAGVAAAETRAGIDLFGPGELWIYNNWDFNALGTIVEQATDTTIGQLFDTEVASRIEMEDYVAEDVEYTTKESRTEQHFDNWSEHRAYVFDISTRDLARFGLLYLNCGQWNDQAVVPEKWVLESITGVDTRIGRPPERRNTRSGDYGYLWWVERDDRRRYDKLSTPEPYYVGSGYRGHVMFVMPYLDLVIAHQVATVGGVGYDAQILRATHGTPQVSNDDIQRLVAAIIAAHPHGDRNIWQGVERD